MKTSWKFKKETLSSSSESLKMDQQTKMEHVLNDKASGTLKSEKLEVETFEDSAEEAAEKHKAELEQKSKAIIQERECSGALKQPFRTKQIIPRYNSQKVTRDQDPVLKIKTKEKQLQDEKRELETELNTTKEKVQHASQEWTKCKWTNRKLNKKIQPLTAQVDVLQEAYDQQKNENKALTDKMNYIENLYFKERMKNLDLREVLRKESFNSLPEDHQEAIACDLLEREEQRHTEMEREEQRHTEMDTAVSRPHDVQAGAETKGKSQQGTNRHQKKVVQHAHESDR